jgi:hypothetical protein
MSGRMLNMRSVPPGRMILATCAAVLCLAAAGDASGAQPRCVRDGTAALREDPGRLGAAYHACAPAMRAALTGSGMPATARHARALFAMAVANRHATYGPQDILVRFHELRRQGRLSCAGYAMLAGAIFTRIGGDPRALLYAGWDGGAVGNHVQLLVGRSLLIDPTVGVAARTRLRPLMRGRPAAGLLELGRHDVDSSTGRVGRELPGGFRSTVRDALTGGRYRPEDALYTLTAREMRGLHARFRAAVRRGGDWRDVPIPPPRYGGDRR